MPDTLHFLSTLFAQSNGYLTLTAIHPDGKHPTPSRHIPMHDKKQLEKGLSDLLHANALGWGAYAGVGLRRADLGRWRRGGKADLLALPALFVDIDAPPDIALPRLRTRSPPSAIILSGGGVHAYWFLDPPTTDFRSADHALRYLRQQFGGDALSIANSMRLPNSRNTKPHRKNALCQIHTFSDRRYPLAQFVKATPRKTVQTVHTAQTVQHSGELNARLLDAVSSALLRDYDGYYRRNGWLAARCPCSHERDRAGQHFSFNPSIGLGVCFGKHGRLLLKDLCTHLSIYPSDYGGIYRKD